MAISASDQTWKQSSALGYHGFHRLADAAEIRLLRLIGLIQSVSSFNVDEMSKLAILEIHHCHFPEETPCVQTRLLGITRHKSPLCEPARVLERPKLPTIQFNGRGVASFSTLWGPHRAEHCMKCSDAMYRYGNDHSASTRSYQTGRDSREKQA